jgi:hypothetical protein
MKIPGLLRECVVRSFKTTTSEGMTAACTHFKFGNISEVDNKLTRDKKTSKAVIVRVLCHIAHVLIASITENLSIPIHTSNMDRTHIEQSRWPQLLDLASTRVVSQE